jgi:hypothetical protein
LNTWLTLLFQTQLLSVSAVSLVSAGDFYPSRAYEFGDGPSGTAQVTISGNLDGIRANLTAGAAEPMPL